MRIVHLECAASDKDIRREHFSFPMTLEGLRFSTWEARDAEWLVVPEFIKTAVTTSVPHQRRILLVTEPNGHFPPAYVNQFGLMVSPFAVSGFQGTWIQSHGALPSQFAVETLGSLGRLSEDDLANLPLPEKRAGISVVVSRKSVLPGHRQRLKFVKILSAALGDRLELYGRGFRPIVDKADAILPAKYHLVLENTVMPSYWTEKLADAYLGYAFPFVSGPPDLARWFPAGSFLAIDISKPDEAISAIIPAMDSDIHSQRLPLLKEARDQVLRNERIAPLISRVIAAHPDTTPRLTIPLEIHPQPKLPLPHRLWREIRRFYWAADERKRHWSVWPNHR